MLDAAQVAGLFPPPLVDASGEVRRELTVVDLDAPAAAGDTALLADTARLLGVTVGVTARPEPPAAHLEALTLTLGPPDATARAVVPCGDLDGTLARLAAAVAANPVAAHTLDGLLRTTAVLEPPDGLVAESLAYSALLAGPEFTAWLAQRGPARPRHGEPVTPVRVERDGAVLRVTLARPHRRNAYDRALRDALADALAVALADPSLTTVVLAGDGPTFCSGGDLDEFGTAADPATAHLVRITAGAGRLVYALRDRLTAFVHGSCVGAGVELPAFARTVVAAPGTTFRLPEIAMGLIPGAGGTVSITRRLGRWRTAYLALSGQPVDAVTARDWGLVDAIGDA